MSWEAGALAREAVRNVVANPGRSLVGMIIGGAAIGALAYLELRQAGGARQFEADFEAAGGYVAVVSAQGGVDAGRCDLVQRWTGVQAAGAVALDGTVSFATAPGVLFQSARVTAGALEAWSPGGGSPAVSGYLAGPALANELGLRAGSRTALVGGEPELVKSIVAGERRNPRMARWLLSVAPPAFAADECWVAFGRGTYDAGLAALPAWFATGSGDVVVRPYIRRDEFTRDIAAEFRERPQRLGWLAVGALIVAVLLLAAWFRRAELGLYLALGTPRRELAVLLAVEDALLVTAGFVAASAWLLAAERVAGRALAWDQVVLALRSGGSGALLALAVAPAVSTLVARGNLLSLLKDR